MMSASRILLLASLVLLNNALLFSVPANACGGPCEPKQACVVGGCPTLGQQREICRNIKPFGCCLELSGIDCDDFFNGPCNFGDGQLTCPFYPHCV